MICCSTKRACLGTLSIVVLLHCFLAMTYLHRVEYVTLFKTVPKYISEEHNAKYSVMHDDLSFKDVKRVDISRVDFKKNVSHSFINSKKIFRIIALASIHNQHRTIINGKYIYIFIQFLHHILNW